MTKNLVVIIMAGGLGKRMESDLPKVLHPVCEKPMLVHILYSLKNLYKIHKIFRLMIVVGKYRDVIKTTLDKYMVTDDVIFVDQLEPQGTGHAIQCCREELLNEKYDNSDVLILSGDVPLLSYQTMFKMVDNVENVRIMTTILKNPIGYGRIIINEETGEFEKIVEEKDCTEEERERKMVNCGIYTINRELLCKYLPYLNNNNAQREYYLTDIIEIIKKNEKCQIEMCQIEREKQFEIIGVNTKQQLKELEVMIK